MARFFLFIRLPILTFALLVLGTAGCGGKHPVATVSGKVTVAGKNPLPGGNITFYLASNNSLVAGSVIKSDGTFEVVDVPVGECKVVVDNTNMDVSRNPSGMPIAGAGMTGMTGMGGMPGKGAPSGGPPAGAKEKMTAASAPKGVELDPAMSAEKDTGTKKYVKIDPAFTKLETTTLRHTVVKGENGSVTFDVK